MFFSVFKMKVFALLVFIPSLVAAEVLCPNSKTTCPEDKHCCEVDGEYSCCDAEDDTPATRSKVFAGDDLMRSAVFANTSILMNGTKLFYGECNLFTCPGTCCSTAYDACCPDKLAACCGNNKCCPSLGKCCSGGCCGSLQTCCGRGCCDLASICCGTWCCQAGYRCGSRSFSCISNGTVMSPEILALLLMVATVLISNRL